MKTISQLIKEIFAVRDQSKTKSRAKAKPEETPVSDNQQNSLTPKSNENERETEEVLRDSGVASPAAQEIDRRNEKCPEPSAECQGGETGTLQASGTGSQEGSDGRGADRGRESGGIDREEEAYQRGLRDGRNMVIEERYFPKTDDGVPHFRGNPTRVNATGDIFSMAREA